MTDTPSTPPQINPQDPHVIPKYEDILKADKWAQQAFFLGLGSIICFPASPLAIGCAILALVKHTTQKWMAVTGLILGLVFPLSLAVVILVPAVQASRAIAREDACRANMKALGTALIMYRNNNSVYPPDLDTLLKSGMITDDCLLCPSSEHHKGARDYLYVCPSDEPNSDIFPQMIVACDIGKWHRNDGRTIVRADGTVYFDTGDKSFQEFLANPINAKFAAALKKAEAGGR